MKHIESILPEYAADELDRIVREEGDATATAALTSLLHDWTGCDIPQTSDLPESEVEELVPLCVSILRRHWQTPLTCLGDGTTPMSLSDLMRQAIGDRVQGNEAWSIPAVHANLPTALAALRDRDMSSGLTLTLSSSADGTTTMPLLDGLSLAQLLCGSIADKVTEIKDSNTGWVMTKALTNLPNLEKLELGCRVMDNCRLISPATIKHLSMPMLQNATYSTSIVSYQNQGFVQDMACEEVEFPSLVSIYVNGYGTFLSRFNQLKVARFPMLKSFEMPWQGGIVAECALVEEIYMPVFNTFITSADGRNKLVIDCPQLRKVVLGANVMTNTDYKTFVGCPNLSHLEILNEVKESMFLSSWSPTTALAERLDEFLSNFQLYIADRVVDRTGQTALTLTLSAAVYEALQAQEGQTILATLTNKNWTVAQA